MTSSTDNPGSQEQCCWEIEPGFCAERANGRARCPKRFCLVADLDLDDTTGQLTLPEL